MQETLFDRDNSVNCERCGTQLKMDAVPGSKAKMLHRSKVPKGLCVNCAVHDFLRHTYPPNIQLAQSGPGILLYPHIQELFTNIMKAGFADAKPEEIDWDRIVENWDLPFPTKVKPSGMNPCSQKMLDEVAAGKRPGLGSMGPLKRETVCGDKMTIRSFEELNELEPGLGDSLKNCLQKGGKIGDAEK